MRRAVQRLALLIVAFIVAVAQASAEPATGEKEGKARPKETLKQKSLDPTSDLKQVQIQNRFIPASFEADGYANILNTAIVYPIPKSEAFPVRQVWQLELPILTAPGGPTGLSDLRLLGVFVLGYQDTKKQRLFRYALGPVFVFPTETKTFLGRKKWQVGPAAAAIFQSRKWQLAMIIQNPISFAGDNDRDDVNRLIWQPLLSYFLPKGWYLGLQGTAKSINWKNDAALTLPLSFRIGRVTKFGRRSLNVFVEPEYTAVHDDGPAPQWSIQLGFNFLFPL